MWVLAWRNIWRNRTRTTITLTSIALALSIQLMTYGINASSFVLMDNGARRAAGGDILVHSKGYWQARSADLQMRQVSALQRTLTDIPGVQTVVPRVLLTGLASSPDGNTGVAMMGIVPELEALIEDRSKHLVGGAFLKTTGRRAPAVVGVGVAEQLGLELGDKLVLTLSDHRGEVSRALFELNGLLRTGIDELDNSLALTTLNAAQRAINLSDGASQIALLVEDGVSLSSIAAAIQAELNPSTVEPRFEALTWRMALPEMESLIAQTRLQTYIFGLIIFLVVGFAIANTVLMSVVERIRELGLLGALGMSPQRLGMLMLLEAGMIATIGVSLGLALGYLFHSLIAEYGIDFGGGEGSLEVAGVYLEDLVVYSVVTPAEWLLTSAVAFCLVVACSLLAAWRAARLDPATAMRTYA